MPDRLLRIVLCVGLSALVASCSSLFNSRPIADAGPDQSVATGIRVTLDGSSSFDPGGEPIAFAWSLERKPISSSSNLEAPTTASPSFTPDVDGTYVVALSVSNGAATSSDQAVITATTFDGVPIVLDSNSVALDGVSFSRVAIYNSNDVSVDWNVVAAPAWLSVSPARGTLAPRETRDLLFVVDRAYVPVSESRPLERLPGTHAGTVEFESVSGSVRADVVLTVGDEPTSNACAADAASSWVSSPVGRAASSSLRHDVRLDRVDREPTHVIVKVRTLSGIQVLGERAALDRAAARIASAYGLSDRRPGPGRGVEIARIPAGVDPEAFVGTLNADTRVVYAELDRPLYPQQMIPNDPDLVSQWAACHFGLPSAWDVWTGRALDLPDAPKSTIAIIDSGVDLDHPDLAARMIAGYDFCPVASARMASDCTDAEPQPGGEAGGDAHGTHVAGIAGAVGDNAAGIAGVAFGGSYILPVKVFDDRGSVTSVASVARAIYWAVGSSDPAEIGSAAPNPQPAKILNLSLGGPGTSTTLDDAIRYATDAGALVFVASGNGSSSTAHNAIFMPADAPDAIAVGSVNSNFERSSFSRYSAAGGPTVDLMAPGGFRLSDGSTIYSTYLGDTYNYLGGTSMATPYVSGVAALLWSLQPGLTRDQVLERIRSTSYLDGAWDPHEYGAGVVCADRALGATTTCGMP